MTLARPHPKRDERGAVLVEAALILPIFFALVLGMFTFGDAYFTRISIEDAVRDGARFAATMDGFDNDATDGDDDHQVVKDRIVQLSGNEVGDSDICVAIVTVPAAENDTTCDVADPEGSAGDDVIKVKASTTQRVEVIFFSRDLELNARAAATYERSGS